MDPTKEDIEKLAAAVFENANKAKVWLTTTNNTLDGETPYSKIRSAEGRKEVVAILNKIVSGEFT